MNACNTLYDPYRARRTLRQLALSLALSLALATGVAASAAAGALEADKEAGILLRNGSYAGASAYVVPENLNGIAPARWPAGGWYRVTRQYGGMDSTAVSGPSREMPDFLVAIAAQVHRSQFDTGDALLSLYEAGYDDTTFYLRMPGAALTTGALPVYRFANAALSLNPEFDHRYTLSLHGKSFAVTVRDGARARDGYGAGARYTIEYDSRKFEYSLGAEAPSSRILAIMDIDGDGRPDFHIATGDGTEFMLLSTLAKPGRNIPSASLAAAGD